jgi:outer membrane lipoprotein SlyB
MSSLFSRAPKNWASLVRALGLSLGLVLAGLSGCASAPQAPAFTGTGVVVSIGESQQADSTKGMVGAIGGALVGGWLGSQVGGGTGQVIATAAGSIAGSMAGGSMAAKGSAQTVWRVSVRFEDGIDRGFTVTQQPNYRPGDRVLVSNGAISPLR